MATDCNGTSPHWHRSRIAVGRSVCGGTLRGRAGWGGWGGRIGLGRGSRYLSEEGDEVVFTQRVDLDVADHHHAIVLLVKHRIVQHVLDALVVPAQCDVDRSMMRRGSVNM